MCCDLQVSKIEEIKQRLQVELWQSSNTALKWKDAISGLAQWRILTMQTVSAVKNLILVFLWAEIRLLVLRPIKQYAVVFQLT